VVVVPETVDARATDALLRCVARFGLSKTTLDDVAREAGCSRATLYRYFESKPELLRRTIAAEGARVLARVLDAAREQVTLADAVVAVVTTAARALDSHHALQFLLTHEPDAVLGHLAFVEGDAVLVHAGDAVAPAFARWLDAADASRAGDWIARVVRSYVLMPEPPIDLADESAARPFLEQFVIPGLVAGTTESR
jgi:AcrR family transcriptional regulator